MSSDASNPFSIPRRYKRCRVDVRVGLLRDSRFQFVKGLELSEGGMLVEHGGDLRIGELIEIYFTLPGELFVSASARVIYLRNPSTEVFHSGLRFEGLSPATQVLIRRYVDTL